MMRKVIAAFFIVIISIITLVYWNNSTEKENNTVCQIILNYHEDFGSYSINQSTFMGRSIWQWQNHNENPNAIFDIKVIIYDASIVSLSELSQQYKISEKYKKDYRFITVQDTEKFIQLEEEEYREALTSCQKDLLPSCSQFDYISKLKSSLEQLKSTCR